MRVLGVLIRKEFIQIFRNKAMLPILFVMPLVQLLILTHAASFDVKRIAVMVRDNDATEASRGVVRALEASDVLDLRAVVTDAPSVDRALQNGDVTVAVVIPPGFERERMAGRLPEIQILADAVDGLTANLAVNYVLGTIGAVEPGRIDVGGRYRYNPTLNDDLYMVPGILVLLVTMIAGFLSAMNVVREREIGTMEQLNVTPVRKSEFIIAKLFPFWVIGLVELSFGLFLGWLVFGLVSQGSLALIFFAAMIYLLAILGFGLLISTVADTQQQAMLVAWFVMVVFILMSGLFTPVASMPQWAQVITWFNPVMWFIDFMRRVMLVGAGVGDVWRSLVVLLGFAVALNGLAVARVRKRG